MVALLGGHSGERQLLINALNATTRRSGLDISRMMLGREPGVTMMLVSWSFRGEFRALVATALCSYTTPTKGEALTAMSPASSFDVDGRKSRPSDLGDGEVITRGLIGRGAPTLEIAVLRKSLHEFVQARDSSWTRFCRTVLRKGSTRCWMLPLGCTVQERVGSSGVSWSIQFESIEELERACVLAEARIRSGKARQLMVSPPEGSDGAETMMPELRIRAYENSHGARVEMAKLMQSLLKSLERLSFGLPTSPSMLDVLN